MVMHKFDVFDKENVCKIFGAGNSSTTIEEVTCLSCLRIEKEGWEKQVKEFNGQPLRNAQEGLKRVKKQLSKLTKQKERVITKGDKR
jgi:hypothetical protein